MTFSIQRRVGRILWRFAPTMIDDATESAYVKAIETMFAGLPVAEGMKAFAASLDPAVPTELRTSIEKLGSLSQQSLFNNWLTEQLVAHP